MRGGPPQCPRPCRAGEAGSLQRPRSDNLPSAPILTHHPRHRDHHGLEPAQRVARASGATCGTGCEAQSPLPDIASLSPGYGCASRCIASGEHCGKAEELVGAARFELATPSPPDWCANRAALRSAGFGRLKQRSGSALSTDFAAFWQRRLGRGAAARRFAPRPPRVMYASFAGRFHRVPAR